MSGAAEEQSGYLHTRDIPSLSLLSLTWLSLSPASPSPYPALPHPILLSRPPSPRLTNSLAVRQSRPSPSTTSPRRASPLVAAMGVLRPQETPLGGSYLYNSILQIYYVYVPISFYFIV